MTITLSHWELPPIEPNQPVDSICLQLRWPDDAPVDITFSDIFSDVSGSLEGIQTRETILEGIVGNEQPIGFRFYMTPEQASITLQQLRSQFESLTQDFAVPPPAEISITTIAQADWENAWKTHWHVTPISDRLTICPSWEADTYQANTDEKRPNEQVIILDPGRAFGTGSHGTTRMTLQALDDWAQTNDLSQKSVLDLGCGSGVLAIAAAKLGATDIVALDIMEDAIASTQENAERNNVSHTITASTSPLCERCLTPFDLILANIQAQVIVELLPSMVERLNESGVILATGIIPEYEAMVTTALEEAGLTITKRWEDTKQPAQPTPSGDNPNEWVLLQAEKL